VVLGVILGPMADENLRRALYIFADEPAGFVFTQYVGDVLLVVVALIFLEGVLRLRRTGKGSREGTS
jgi:putative tricarboxylic transport membrane protein